MKKRILASFAILAIFALTIAAYAYTRTQTPSAAKTCCCSKSADSCPMKGEMKHSEGGEHAKMSCCEKHGGDHAKTEGAACDCCSDSCPMKAKADGAAASTQENGKSCCDDCECCKDKEKTNA